MERNDREVLDLFLAKMTPKPREACIRRHEAMLRELKYRRERDDRRLAFIRVHGWSDQRLSVLFALNTVYQEILGPLQASARSGAAGIGREHPVRHGSKEFGPAHNADVHAAITDFFSLVAELRFQRSWMTLNTCGDVIYYIERAERERE